MSDGAGSGYRACRKMIVTKIPSVGITRTGAMCIFSASGESEPPGTTILASANIGYSCKTPNCIRNIFICVTLWHTCNVILQQNQYERRYETCRNIGISRTSGVKLTDVCVMYAE